jgi:uncharacterized repeat protein (TIGR03943 family)
MVAADMSRELQGGILMLVGIVTLRVSWGTTYLNYVKEGMRPWLLLSGAVLLVLGLLAVIDAVRGRGDEDDPQDSEGESEGEPGDGHVHAHGGPRTAWLLLLPVFTLFVVAPPALGAYSASRDVTNSVAAPQLLPPLPPGDPVPMYLSDYVTRAVWEKGVSLEGRTVTVTGFVLPTQQGWQLARLQILCCAADAFTSKAQPTNLPAAFARPPADTWVTVTGHWVPGGGTESGTAIPLLEVDSIVEIEQPVNPYD